MKAFPVCAKCGEIAPVPDARFCENCGAPFDAGAAPEIRISSSATRCRCEAPDYDEDDVCRECGLPKPVTSAVTHIADMQVVIDDRLAFASDKGRKYTVNQDSGCVDRRSDGAVLMVVADGVSTTAGSDKASDRAAAAAKAAFRQPSGTLVEQARACVLAAGQAVLELQSVVDPAQAGEAPSTTIVLAILKGADVVVAWVGDSRAYLIEKSGARLLTQDDSWAEDVVSQGLANREDALKTPQAHAITQWLGAPLEQLSIHIGQTSLFGCEAVALCSDGLWNYLDSPAQFGKVFRLAARDGVAAAVCRTLVDVAYRAGGRDNISVAVCLLSRCF